MAEVHANVPYGDSTNGVYAQSFGNLPHGTQYGGYTNPDIRAPGTPEAKSLVGDVRAKLFNRYEANVKAIGTTAGGAGTAGYALIPVYLDPMIVDQTRKETPLTEIFPRVSNQGITAEYNFITAKGGGFVAAEDAALDETDTTYDRGSVAIKYLYAVGRVTGPALAATPSASLMGFQPTGGAPLQGFSDANAPNALQREILVKAREIKELEENLLINGDDSSDPNEFDGFVTQISTTNKLDKNTTALSLDDVQTAVRYAVDDGGRPNLAVCDTATYEDLLKLLNAKIGYLQPVQQVFFGFQTVVLNTMAGQIPVVWSRFMSTTTGAKSIYFLDLRVIEVRTLMDMTFERLAKTNDSDKFMLKMYECLIIRAPAFCSWVGEIA